MLLRDLIRPFASSRTLLFVSFLALCSGVYAALPYWKEHSAYRDLGDMPSGVHATLTLVLGCLLVFRTNTAYARWWEARTLWGSLTNASRNIALKVCSLGSVPADQQRLAIDRLTAFPYALCQHLRASDLSSPYAEELKFVSQHTHRPAAIAHSLYQQVSQWKKLKLIDGDELRVIDRDLAQLMDVCGACERILKTPIARSYRVFARQCVWMFLLTFPWGIIAEFDLWTIPLTVLMAYFMLGLEIVAEHVEEPFGHDEDDLDLEGMCDGIRKTLKEIAHYDV